MGYYNPSIPQENPNMQSGQQFQQMPVQQPQQVPMQTPTPIMQSQPTNDLLFVLNETEASAYPVAPNNSVVLWDKNNKTFYIKTANAQGIPSMQIYDFSERKEMPENAQKTHECSYGDKFATKEQIADLRGKIEELSAKYEELSRPIIEKAKTNIKKPKESEE
jgi:hypothetical protein